MNGREISAMTVLDLIKSSLRLIGALAANSTPNAETERDVRETLNLLLGEWRNRGLLALSEKQTFNVVSGTNSYTIGTGLTWNGRAPLKITSAYLTIDSTDYQLEIIGESEYMEIADKTLSARPSKLFYMPNGEDGTVYLFGEPDENCTITIVNPNVVNYTSGSTSIELPSGYLQALKYALAVELIPEWGETSATNIQIITRRATETMAAIKSTNLKKSKPIQFDTPFSGCGNYNSDSDTWE